MKMKIITLSLVPILVLITCGRSGPEPSQSQSYDLGMLGVCTANFDNKHLEKYGYIAGPRECVVKIGVFADGQPLEGIGISLWFANYLQTSPSITNANGIASFSVNAGSYEIVRWEISYSESNPASASTIRTMDLCDFGISMTKPLTALKAIPKGLTSDDLQWPTIRYCSRK